MTEQKPVDDLAALMKEWKRIKSVIEDTECGGETFDFLAEYSPAETGTAQHAMWRGCQQIVELCEKINNRLNMAYDHPIRDEPQLKAVEPGLCYRGSCPHDTLGATVTIPRRCPHQKCGEPVKDGMPCPHGIIGGVLFGD